MADDVHSGLLAAAQLATREFVTNPVVHELTVEVVAPASACLRALPNEARGSVCD
jgi:hypothetical protein